MSSDSPSSDRSETNWIPPVAEEPSVVLWCIANGVDTTKRIPEETMFSERECHGLILSLAKEELVTYSRAQWWQETLDGETFYRRHKRATPTEDGWDVVRRLRDGWMTPQVLDRHVIGDPLQLEE